MDDDYKYGDCDESNLFAGTMVQDVLSGDVGILTRRYDVMREWDSEIPIWAWDMTWSGPSTDVINRHTPFTELGILGLINSGRWVILNETPKDVD